MQQFNKFAVSYSIKAYYEKSKINLILAGDFSWITKVKETMKLAGLNYQWDKAAKIWNKHLPDDLESRKKIIQNDFNWFYTYYQKYINESDWKDIAKEVKQEAEPKEAVSVDFDLTRLPSLIAAKIMPHQKLGVLRFGDQDNMILNAFSMGCLHGDTVVTINRFGASKRIKMRDLHNRWDNSKKANYKDGNTFIRSFDFNEGIFKLYELGCSMYSGMKETIKLTLEDGKELICTKDHEIYTDRGYIEADKLTENDLIWTNGREKLNSEKYMEDFRKDGYVYVRGLCVKNHPYKQKTWYGSGISKHRLMYESFINNFKYGDWINILESGINLEQYKFINPKLHEVHHINEIRNDNRVENLELISRSVHSRKHKFFKHFSIFIPKKQKLIKKEYFGVVDTYDLHVPNSNCFVANGILLSNCGKTISSLATVKYYNKKSFIIVPKSLVLQWKEEILKWKVTTEDKIFTFTDNKEFNLGFINRDYDFYILNYEKLRFLSDPEIDKTTRKRNWTEYESQLYKDFMKMNKQDYILIYDEAYKIKNYKSDLFKAHKKFRNLETNDTGWGGVIVLTGTPLENYLYEFYTILNFVKPNTISYQDMERYFVFRAGNWGKPIYRNLALFNKMASSVMLRVSKDEVKLDLPKLVYEYRFVEHSSEAHAIKKKLIENAPSVFEIYSLMRVLDSYLDPQDVDSKYHQFLKTIEHTKKLEEVFSILEEIGDKQVLIFTAYEKTAKWLCDKLIKEGHNSKWVSAQTKNKDEVKQEFIDGKVKIVVATDTWAYGVNFNQIDYMIMYDLLANPAKLAQRRDRIHRLDSINPKLVITLVSDVVEMDIYKIIKNKIEMSEVAVDGTEEKDLLGTLSKTWGIKITANQKPF